MPKIKAIELASGQWVYVQVNESITLAPPSFAADDDDDGFVRKGGSTPSYAHKAVDKLGDIIRAMSDTAAQALKDSSLGNVEKVTLEFGVTLGGEIGIPYITSGNAEGAVSVTVEFAPKKEN